MSSGLPLPYSLAYNGNMGEDNNDPYKVLISERSPELFCDACGYYPIEPVHGHFMCPSCKMPTKCCEGTPIALGGNDEDERLD
jgi:hypothetical protein